MAAAARSGWGVAKHALPTHSQKPLQMESVPRKVSQSVSPLETVVSAVLESGCWG